MATAGMKVELSIAGQDGAAFRVTRFQGEQALSQVDRFEVEANVEAAVDPEDLLGRDASLDLDLWGSARRFQGVVVEADVEMVRESVFRIRVAIAPKLLLASLNQSSRVFQDQTVKDVVATILGEAGVERVRWQLTEVHPKRPLVLQHQESDLAFAERLLAEEGISFAFTPG